MPSVCIVCNIKKIHSVIVCVNIYCVPILFKADALLLLALEVSKKCKYKAA